MAAATFKGNRPAILSRALMLETTRLHAGRVNFARLAASNIDRTISTKKVREQSSPESPVVRLMDLKTNVGDTVYVDVDHRLTGLPVMGNEDAEGKEDELTQSQYSCTLDLARYPVKAGSRLDQQRTPYDLYKRAKNSIVDWSVRYDNEMWLYQSFGMRGDYEAIDTILPLENHVDMHGADFNTLMINPLSPPTHNRTFFCDDTGTVNTVDAALGFTSGRTPVGMTAASTLSIESLERLKLMVERMPMPPQRAVFEIPNKKGMTTPMYVLVVSPKMWNEMRTGGDYEGYQLLVANALKRTSGWDHPLFQGDMIMMGDILVCKAPYTVRFKSGSKIPLRDDNKDGTVRMGTVPAGFDIECGILMGAQMLAHVCGRTISGQHWSMKTRKYDFGEKRAVAIGKMQGMKKIVFRDRDNYLYDNGCITVMSAVTPDPV